MATFEYQNADGEVFDGYDLYKMYDEVLNGVYGDVDLVGVKLPTSRVWKDVDLIGYRVGFMDWLEDEGYERKALKIKKG